jgi:hypothetical protein
MPIRATTVHLKSARPIRAFGVLHTRLAWAVIGIFRALDSRNRCDLCADHQLVTTAPTHRPAARLLLPILLFATALSGRLCYLARPFDHDAACFIYMGKMTAEGDRLGRDLFDNKFPTVGLMTSAAWRVFGNHWAGYVALEALLSLASAAVLAGSVPMPRRRATFCFAAVFLNFTPAVFGGFQLETLQVFFNVLAAAGLIRASREGRSGPAFVAGLSAGCAAMFKPTGIAVLAAGLICIGIRRSRSAPKLLIATAAGLAVPTAVAAVFLVGTGVVAETGVIFRQISTYASESVFDRIELLKPLTAVVILGFPLFVTAVVFRRRSSADFDGDVDPSWLFPAVWIAIEMAGVLMQRRMYAYHFLPLVPPAALLFGSVRASRGSWAIAASLGPAAAVTAATAFAIARSPGPATTPVGDYLATHARPCDAVWMEQWPRTTLETGLQPGSRFASTFLFANYDSAGLDYSAIIVDDFARTRPAFIVLPADVAGQISRQATFIPELAARPVRAASYAAGWRRIERYTLENYSPVAAVDDQVIYRRR